MNNELQEILTEKSESSKDDLRTEEQWRCENEDFFILLQSDIIKKAKAHDEASHKNKKMYIRTAIPAMVAPILLTNLSIFCSSQTNEYIQPIGLSLVGIINVFQTILNFSKKKEIHNLYAGKYMELYNEIEKVLIRRKKHRDPFDVTLERITTRKQNLDDGAPYL